MKPPPRPAASRDPAWRGVQADAPIDVGLIVLTLAPTFALVALGVVFWIADMRYAAAFDFGAAVGHWLTRCDYQ